jgi:hypothetical protein
MLDAGVVPPHMSARVPEYRRSIDKADNGERVLPAPTRFCKKSLRSLAQL